MEYTDDLDFGTAMEFMYDFAENPPYYLLAKWRWCDPKKMKPRRRHTDPEPLPPGEHRVVVDPKDFKVQPGTVPFDRLPLKVQQRIQERKEKRAGKLQKS